MPDLRHFMASMFARFFGAAHRRSAGGFARRSGHGDLSRDLQDSPQRQRPRSAFSRTRRCVSAISPPRFARSRNRSNSAKSDDNGVILDADPILASNGGADGDNPVVRTEQTQGDHARVKATFGSPKVRRSVLYFLIREDGAWRIDDIQDVPDEKGAEAWSIRKVSDQDMATRKKDGYGTPPATIAEWRKAAETGDGAAMNRLGLLYANGFGVAKSPGDAFAWYKKGAEAGDPRAMDNLGLAYDAGEGTSVDAAQAARWYRKAADAGDAAAMNHIGAAYRQGTGVARDLAEAFRWFQKSADAGDAGGMNNLGYAYRNGEGVAKNEQEAQRWMNKAAQ